MSKAGAACVKVTVALGLVLFAPVVVLAADISEKTSVDLKVVGAVLSVAVSCTLYLGGKLNELRTIGERLKIGDERFKDHEDRLRRLEGMDRFFE